MKTFAAILAAGVATSASAQTELCITAATADGTNWTLTAELLNPTGSVLAAVADLGFTMSGSGFANFAYNAAFDSDFFGPAAVTVTGTSVDFLGGNTLPPLNNAGGVDSSNPLAIATFTADSVSGMVLNGQVTGAYAGVPFPVILTYQDANGGAGDTPWSFKVVPAPASAALLGLGGLAAARRRR
jgi:MYXO-CTERM domain-containing protein